jgi:hypothetical protein
LFGREVAVSEEGWTVVGGTKGADVERESVSVSKGWMQGALDVSVMLAICQMCTFWLNNEMLMSQALNDSW